MLEDVKDWVLTGLGTSWLAVMTWIGKRKIDEIDHLHATKANKDSTDVRLNQLHSDLKEISIKVDHTNELLGQNNTALAHLSGRFEQMTKDTNR
jgi:hypothetical protein